MDSTFRHSPSDIGLIVFGLILVVVGIVTIMRKRQQLNSYRQALFPTLFGLAQLIIATVGNSLVTARWDSEYIIAFLLLIRLDKGIFFRGMIFIGYAFLILGITTLVIVIGNRSKKRHSK